MQSLNRNINRPASLEEIAEQLRDHIWIIVETWMRQLELKKADNLWNRIPETQLVDNVPGLLRGVSKAIEEPERSGDFKPGGVIYEAAAELGANRYQQGYTPAELLHELDLLRDIIWRFCRENFSPNDFYGLEERINRPLDKITSTVTERYIKHFENEVKQLARRDRLTGFYNYESFKELLNEELKRSKRYRRACSLILVDIDGFTEYIETFGNDAGDNLLREVALVISQTIRDVDLPVRYSSDKFAIILPEANKKQAQKAAERLRRAVKIETRHQVTQDITTRLAVTTSIGLASYPKDAETANDLISLADGALYEAKKAGRDMVMAVDTRKRR